MVTNISGVSNFNAETKADYPSVQNGNTFSVDGGFCFTLSFTTENNEDNGNYCLIQLVTNSERILENATYRQSSSFGSLPVLDGDVMDVNNLWYSEATELEVTQSGNFEIVLTDDPQTASGEGFYGPPTSLHVNEQFTIIFAKYLGEGNYEQLQKWEWGYSDTSTKVGPVWANNNFNSAFGGIIQDVDLSIYRGGVRANNLSHTEVVHKNKSIYNTLFK